MIKITPSQINPIKIGGFQRMAKNKKLEVYYRIESYTPQEGMSSCGFLVFLDLDVARKLAKIPKPKSNWVKEQADKTNKFLFGDRPMPFEVYRFIKLPNGEDSCMLSCVETVGVNGCILYVAGSNIEHCIYPAPSGRQCVKFCCHNVDDHVQAYALLSMWLEWYNRIDVFLENQEVSSHSSTH